MKTICTLFLSCLYFIAASQVNNDYRSTGNVSLTSASNWETYSGGTWSAAATAPNSASLTTGNTITIQSGHTWNNTAASTIPEGVTLLFQGAAGTFSANTLTINGTYIHASGAAPSTVFTAVSMTTGLGANSTVVYRASASYATPSAALGGRTYNNLTYDTDGSTTTQPSFATPGFTSPVTVNGTLTVDTWKADFYTSGNTTALNLNGDIVLTGTNSYLRVRTFTLNTGKTLTINATDSLGIGNAFAVTINGTLVNKSLKPIAFSTGSTLIVNGTYQHDANGGNMPNGNTTYSATSTLLVTGVTNVSNIPVLPANCGGNVIWNCAAQTASNTFVNTTSNSTTIGGNLTIQSTGTATIYLGGAGTGRTLTVNGNLIINGGKLGIIKPSTGATGNQTCTVNGDINLSSGDLYVADALSGATGYTGKGYLNINGNLNHTGGNLGDGSTTLANTGVITFTGNNTNKTIVSTGIAGAPAIIIDKTASGIVTLNSNLTLGTGATISFVSGKLAINGGNTLEVPAGAISGTSSASYIVTNTSGSTTGLLKITGSTALTVFPVGTATAYLPASITPLTSSDFTAGVFQGVTNNALPNGTAVTVAQKTTIVDAVWLISRTSSNTDNATVTVNWPASLEGSAFNALGTNIGIAGYNGTIWGVFNGTGDNGANTATATFGSFIAFTVGQTGTTLPVRISSVTATASNDKINVSWKTENEINIDQYIIERSNDAIHFEAITAIVAKNNSSTYNYTDAQPFSGKNFYRIKILDKSGRSVYSNIVSVNLTVKGKNELLVYPNPVINKNIQLQLTGMDAGNYTLQLFNNEGQQVYSKSLGNINGTQSIALPLQQNIATGTYRLVVKSNNQQLQQTIIIR